MTSAVTEQFVVGFDDTDVPEAGGTGKLVRALADQVAADGLGESMGVTRHQLLESPKIPMTKRNSAAALVIATARSLDEVEEYAVRFVRATAERGADPGVAVLSRHSDMPHVLAFGRRCQQEVMKLDDADRFASDANVRLRTLGDGREGAIGALGAAGLRAGGGDGRYVGLRGIRELDERVTAGEIRERTGIVSVLDDGTGEELDRDDMVQTDGWVRPRLVGGAPVLIARRSAGDRKVWLSIDHRPAD